MDGTLRANESTFKTFVLSLLLEFRSGNYTRRGKLVGLWGGKVEILFAASPPRSPPAAWWERAIGKGTAKNSLGGGRRTFYHVAFAF